MSKNPFTVQQTENPVEEIQRLTAVYSDAEYLDADDIFESIQTMNLKLIALGDAYKNKGGDQAHRLQNEIECFNMSLADIRFKIALGIED